MTEVAAQGLDMPAALACQYARVALDNIAREFPADVHHLLTEAELMARVLPQEDFADWLGRFLPGIAAGEPTALFTPAVVSDSSDGQIAHLRGLNLSRAWCWRRLAETLPVGDPRRQPALDAARRHAEASLRYVVGDDYMVGHWLAAYAVLLLT